MLNNVERLKKGDVCSLDRVGIIGGHPIFFRVG